MDMDTGRRPAADDSTPVERAIRESSLYGPLEHMEDVPNREMIDSDRSSVSFTVNGGSSK